MGRAGGPQRFCCGGREEKFLLQDEVKVSENKLTLFLGLEKMNPFTY